MERRKTVDLVIRKLLNRWRKERVEQVRGWGQPGEGAECRLHCIGWTVDLIEKVSFEYRPGSCLAGGMFRSVSIAIKK